MYAGETVPDLNGTEYAEFQLHLKKAILFSLEKRNLLTHFQAEECVTETEKHHMKDSSKHQA